MAGEGGKERQTDRDWVEEAVLLLKGNRRDGEMVAEDIVLLAKRNRRDGEMMT